MLTSVFFVHLMNVGIKKNTTSSKNKQTLTVTGSNVCNSTYPLFIIAV